MKRNRLRIMDQMAAVAPLVLAVMVLVLVAGSTPAKAQAPTSTPEPNAASAPALSKRVLLPVISRPLPYPPTVMLQRLSTAENRYPHIVGSAADSCALCHRGQPPAPNHAAGDFNLNNYGFDFRLQNYDWASFESWDSDGDGFRNLAEFDAGSNPGDKASTPDNPGPTVTPVPTTPPPGPTATPGPLPTVTPPPPTPVPSNLISNPGFESWSGSTPNGWTVDSGSVSADGSSHGGNYAARFSGGGNVLYTGYLGAQPDQVVSIDGWFKWTNASGLRMDLFAYDSGHTQLKNWFFTNMDGTAAWRHVSSFALMPARTASVRIRIQLSSGTAWADDMYAGVVQKVPGVDSSVTGPVIVPHPWKISASGSKLAIGNTAIVVSAGESRLQTAADTSWDGVASHTILRPGDGSAGSYATVLRFGDRNTPEIAAAFQAAYGSNTWDQLGNEGYFLSVQKPGAQLQILAGANSEAGRFYALQSIEQIIKSAQIYTLNVLDVPTIAQRGIIMSASRFGSYTATLQKIAGYKMNFSWNQGQFESNKFNYDWRTPLSSGEQSELRDYINQARNNFVTPWLSIGPRASSASGNTTCYSCDSDINLVVSKFSVLYGLGLRNFGLNLDDLNNVGQDKVDHQEDLNRFGQDIAKAHLYFINAVYDRFFPSHSDARLMIVPYACYLAGTFGNGQDYYLGVLSGLRPQIQMYSVQYYNDDYLRQKQLTGRPTMNWSNFYAEGWTPNGTYVAPHYNFFDPFNSTVHNAITGLSFLPVQPGDQDTAQISWTTTADYFWAPDRYNPSQSFQWGAAKYAGK